MSPLLAGIHTGHGRLHDAIGDIKRSIIEKENQTSVPDLSRNSQNIKLENIYTLLAITKNDGKDKESSNRHGHFEYNLLLCLQSNTHVIEK